MNPTDLEFIPNDMLETEDRTVMHSGLTNLFHLDGDAGDSAGSNNGTVYGATTVAGRDGDALSFDETDDYVSIPDVEMNNEFTITFQFRIDENDGSLFQYLYSHGDINSTNSINIFLTENAHGTDPDVMRTVIRDENDTLDNFALQFDVSSIIGDGQWHTYTLTVDATGSTVYLDGVEQNSSTAGGDAINPTGDVILGSRSDFDADRYYGGEMDTLQIYDRALTQSEVTATHTDTAPTIAAGTIVASVSEVTDPDNPTGHTYSLTDDAGGKFVIDPNTGDISLAADHDADTLFSDTITVQVTDPDTNTYTETLGIAIGTESGNDTMTGPHDQNVMYGLGGDDDLTGGSGDDTLDGGAGNDSLTGGSGNDVFAVSTGHDTISDFNTGNTGALDDGDSSNNDFIDLSGHYDHLSELYADQADDGILNQSNTTDTFGNAVDYSDNTQFGAGDSLTFSGASADRSSFTTENTGVVCFTAGTAIRTPRGSRPIETLRPGDLVCTLDNGPQPVCWIGTRRLDHADLQLHPNWRPVLFKREVLGASRDLMLSPQHRILAGPGGQRLMAAKHLARQMPGARICNGIRQVTYIHLMFEQHQIIFAEDTPAESFYPGPMALRAVSCRNRAELAALFPQLFRPGASAVSAYGSPARPVVAQPAQARRPAPHMLPTAFLAQHLAF
ncbi:MAG: Hint domain-containing protein [Rhodobacteraceae bacterium]|nr:Hint domain-containing protein [Paracoccaceae bacterium]